MYVTRPLSLLRRSPELLNSRQKEGPNLGYLVIFDEECETTVCFGLCKDRSILDLPFPQNKDLTVSYDEQRRINNSDVGVHQRQRTYYDDVVFIPVLNEPLSSNRYYVIKRQGKHKGEASVSSTEDDVGSFCCCTFINDVKPKPLDPSDIYHQVEIVKKKRRGFTAMSVAQDGFPPLFLRRKYWRLSMRTSRDYTLNEALGVDSSLRAKFPNLDSSGNVVVVGKWYVPFMFVNEDFGKLKDQMKRSMFYEMSLEQKWHKVFGCENTNGARVVRFEAVVDREEAFVDENKVVCDNLGGAENGVVWFRSGKGGERLLGLSVLVVERMRWEQERVGFRFDERKIEVKRTEEFEGKGEWSKFGCYVLVERFVLKRMDGSVVLTHDFNHTQQLRCKWE